MTGNHPELKKKKRAAESDFGMRTRVVKRDVCTTRRLMDKQLVPPRRGKRNKRVVLPPFNQGKAFQILRCIDSHEKVQLGVRSEVFPDRVWIGHDIAPTPLECFASVECIELPLPPSSAYTTEQAVIGGVGKHLRWKTIMFQPNIDETPDLIISGIRDANAFERTVDKMQPFVYVKEYKADDIEGNESSLLAHAVLTDRPS